MHSVLAGMDASNMQFYEELHKKYFNKAKEAKRGSAKAEAEEELLQKSFLTAVNQVEAPKDGLKEKSRLQAGITQRGGVSELDELGTVN